MEQIEGALIWNILGVVLSALDQLLSDSVYIERLISCVNHKRVSFYIRLNLILMYIALNWDESPLSWNHFTNQVTWFLYIFKVDFLNVKPAFLPPRVKETTWSSYLRTLSVPRGWNKYVDGKNTLSQTVSLVSQGDWKESCQLMHEWRKECWVRDRGDWRKGRK